MSLGIVALLGFGTALAQEGTPAREQSAAAEVAQPAPPAPTPPPGISIMPSLPYMAPPTGEAPVGGCPAGRLKPLDLLV